MRVHFGHCIGCDQPIRPPYLMFAVKKAQAPAGDRVTEWEEVDVCGPCAAKLTAADLHRLVEGEEDQTESARIEL